MILKKEEDIKIMREAGKILAEVMKELEEKALPGVTTQFLNLYAEKTILKRGGKPSFKGYKNFPAALCTSVNEVVVHGIPTDYKIKKGDVLSLDLGVFYNGFHSDMATTIIVGGKGEGDVSRLLRETKKALKRGIKKAKEGNTLGDIGNTIMRHAQKSGFSVAQGLCGHGIGREVHEEPQVLNEGKRHKGIEIVRGMVFCIEPMLTMGNGEVEECPNGEGIKTADNSLAAHFEHTIAITEKGTEILTLCGD
jgi:methionyl aminopeptidase